MVPYALKTPRPDQHLDWFSRFCVVHKFAQHRGRQMREHEMCVAIGRNRVMRAMWPYN